MLKLYSMTADELREARKDRCQPLETTGGTPYGEPFKRALRAGFLYPTKPTQG